MTRTIYVWGDKTFKTRTEVTQAEYDALARGDLNVIQGRINTHDDAVKIKSITVNLYDEDDNLIAEDIEV